MLRIAYTYNKFNYISCLCYFTIILNKYIIICYNAKNLYTYYKIYYIKYIMYYIYVIVILLNYKS